ncbi:MAG TPA: type II secretion system F family protein [Candidatus Acidoferrales bacterium]
MGQFVCKVADASGRVFQHVEAAPSEGEARQRLADRGLYVYSVRSSFDVLPRMGRRSDGHVGGTDFLIFNQQFATLIKAGLPILKALDLLSESAAALKLRPVLNDVRQRVREGALLSEAMQATGAFSKVYTTSVLAGEKSGSLVGVLEHYIAFQRVTSGLKKRLIAALVYPTILVVVAGSILTGIIVYVIPEFAKLYAELKVPLPPVTVLLVTLSLELRFYVLGLVGAIVFGGIGSFFWARTERGAVNLDKLKMRIPVAGDLWIKFQVARFARTLATLVTGGTPLVSALETSADAVGSRYVSQAIAGAAQRVREGQSLHQSLKQTGLMPALALEMIEVGEASGALAQMLTSVAEFYEEDVNLRLTALLNLIEPAVLVFMAVVVAFVLIALYFPIFSFSASGVHR